MKIDITPNDLKMLIDVYDAQMYTIDRVSDENNTNPVVAKKKSRLSELKAIYEGLLDEMRHSYRIHGVQGMYKLCKLYEDMTMDDAMELLDELKYRERCCFKYGNSHESF